MVTMTEKGVDFEHHNKNSKLDQHTSPDVESHASIAKIISCRPIIALLPWLFAVFLLIIHLRPCENERTKLGRNFLLPSSSKNLKDSVLQAKKLLLAVGVPEQNLCRMPSDNVGILNDDDDDDDDDDDTEYLWFLPLCDKKKLFLRPISQEIASERFLEEGTHIPSTEGEEVPSIEDDPWFYILHAFCALLCVTTAALAAGLTMGLLSLDPLMLLIKMRAAGSQREKDQAAAILPIVKQHHRLLVTLLLLNSMANEALPLFLEVLVSPVVAVILSVTFVLFFGEIIPSAVFTGPQKVELASKMVPLVRVVMVLLWPIAYPIAKILDVVLHDDEEEGENAFNRGELSALVRIQYEERMATKQIRKLERAQYRRGNSSRSLMSEQNAFQSIKNKHHMRASRPMELSPSNEAVHSDMLHAETQSLISESSGTFPPDANFKRTTSIHLDEVMIVEGALQMKTTTALDIFCPLNRMYAVPYDLILNEDNVVDIYSSGYSRIPVYERNPEKPRSPASIRGLLITKHLIVVNMNEERPLSTLPLFVPPCVSPKTNLIDLVNLFQTGKRGHFALVCARPKVGEEALKGGKPLPASAGLMGIITLEDALEELLQEQIYDENDRMEKEAQKIARWVCRKWKVLKRRREYGATGKSPLMERVDLDAIAAHENETAGERTSLLRQENWEGGDESSILGTFQNLVQKSNSGGR
jgi:metal transporter CNNM